MVQYAEPDSTVTSGAWAGSAGASLHGATDCDGSPPTPEDVYYAFIDGADLGGGPTMELGLEALDEPYGWENRPRYHDPVTMWWAEGFDSVLHNARVAARLARDTGMRGILFDWEPYGGRDEAGICFGDHCFARFLERRGIAAEAPDRTKRFAWLEERRLVGAYEQTFNERRVEMFTRLVGKLRAINPHLLFSSYRSYRWGLMHAAHAPETPFVVLARRHYHTDDRQAWWESYSAWMRGRGYLCGHHGRTPELE